MQILAPYSRLSRVQGRLVTASNSNGATEDGSFIHKHTLLISLHLFASGTTLRATPPPAPLP